MPEERLSPISRAVSRFEQVAAELAVFDNFGALRGDAFVIVCERAEAVAVFEARVGDHVHDVGGVFEIVDLIEREKTGAGKIGFFAQDAVELNGMADGFVNLQSELAAAENQGAFFLWALRGAVQRDRILRR